MKACRETRIKQATKTVMNQLRRAGFKESPSRWSAEETPWMELGTIRAVINVDDERFDLYAFDGKPGNSSLKYAVQLHLGMPESILTGNIDLIAAAELR